MYRFPNCLTVILVAALLSAVNARRPTFITSTCIGAIPSVPHDGIGCGVPAFVDQDEFGDNANSTGRLIVRPGNGGLDLTFTLRGLSRRDLVMTAWIIWAIPGNPANPEIFQVANIASPCAAYTSAYGTGLGREPNEFQYIGRSKARLRVWLNFNPTFPNEGALTRNTFCQQMDIPGIQETALKQFPVPGTAKFTPVSSSYLRRYDPATGFEKLDAKGRPLVVPSPIRALGIAVAGHIDRTTHGISQGNLGVDHFEIMAFLFPEQPIGQPTTQHAQK